MDTGNPSAAGGSGPNQSYLQAPPRPHPRRAIRRRGQIALTRNALEIDSTAPTVTIQTPLDANGTPDGSLDATETTTNGDPRHHHTGIADGKTVTITITDGTTTISATRPRSRVQLDSGAP